MTTVVNFEFEPWETNTPAKVAGANQFLCITDPSHLLFVSYFNLLLQQPLVASCGILWHPVAAGLRELCRRLLAPHNLQTFSWCPGLRDRSPRHDSTRSRSPVTTGVCPFSLGRHTRHLLWHGCAFALVPQGREPEEQAALMPSANNSLLTPPVQCPTVTSDQ